MNIQVPKTAVHDMGPSYQDILDRDGDAVEVLRLQSTIDQPMDDIPFERYTSQDFFDLEMEKVWRKVWQFACREEHLAEAGDYYVYDIGRYSVVLVRTESGAIKGFFNSCVHRGTKLKPSGTSGNAPVVQCPYHGWTFTLEGTLSDVPCPWEFEHLDWDANHLREVQVDTWNTLVFINLDREAAPLLDYLEIMPEHFKNWDFSGWYTSVHARKELACNWKAAQEAFIEGYHGPMVHPQVTGTAAYGQHDIFGDHVSRDIVALGVPSNRGSVVLTEQDILDGMLMGDSSTIGDARPMVPEGETARSVVVRQLRETFLEDFGLDLSHLSTSEIIDSIKYTLFPNLFVFAGISLRVLYQYRPLGNDPDRCQFDIMFMRPKPKDGPMPDPAEMVPVAEDESYQDVPGMDPGFGLLFDQDTNIMRWQKEGMYTSDKGAETYSSYMESRPRYIHSIIDKYINK